MSLKRGQSGKFPPAAALVAVILLSGANLGMSRELVQPIRKLRGHPGGVRRVMFSPDGKLLASAGVDKAIRLWRVSDGKPVATFSDISMGEVAMAFSPDGQLLALGVMDKTIQLWRISAGNDGNDSPALVKILTGHPGRPAYVVFSPDGNLLASVCRDSTIRLWRVSDGSEVNTVYCPHTLLNFLAFSPDGQRLAIWGSFRKRVEIRRVSDLKLIGKLTVPANSQALTFSSDGELMAATSPHKVLQLSRVSDGSEIRIIPLPNGRFHCIAFSPDGRLLASAQWNEIATTRLWRVSDGKYVKELAGHTNWVFSVAFSPDGRLLASGSWDSKILLYSITEGDYELSLFERALLRQKEILSAGLVVVFVIGVGILLYAIRKIRRSAITDG